MFDRDCYQILSLNFRSSTETVSPEDSQIYFTTETFSCTSVGGGGGGFTRFFRNSWQQSVFQAEKLTENSCQYERILLVAYI